MHHVYPKTGAASRLLGVALLVLVCASAEADSAQATRQQVYQQERQRCLSGQSTQSQKNCLREAGAALQQNMVGQAQPSAEQQQTNALQRCNAFTTADARQSCMARMQGQGTVDGSVGAGGILRALTETVP
jgi:hypothetical protein